MNVDGDEMICEAVGMLERETKTSITIVYWNLETHDEETRMANYEYINIIKSTIIEKKRLKF